MMRRFLLPLFILLSIACSPVCLVREPSVYQAEMDFFEHGSMQSVDSLTLLISQYCECKDGAFTTVICKSAAEVAVVLETRASWHKEMALYLGGLTKKRPSAEPPVIPAAETLCPVE